MISLISLTLFLLLSLLFILFYFVFALIDFANLYFSVIAISVPLQNKERKCLLPPFSLQARIFF